jgi:hypothetical protein
MKFSKKDQKQIEARFVEMFNVLTKNRWAQGAYAVDKKNNHFEESHEIQHNKKNITKMCLIGAVRYINGPTEEEITTLIATQIILDTTKLNDIRDYLKYNSIPNKAAFVYHVYETIFNDSYRNELDPYDEMTHLNDGAEKIIIGWNDDTYRTYAQVRAMLKRAQKLYGKLYQIWELKNAFTLSLGKLNKGF